MKKLKDALQFFILLVFFEIFAIQNFLWAMEEEDLKPSTPIHKPSEKPTDEKSFGVRALDSNLEISKLTKEHFEKLKGICSQFVTEKIGGSIPMDPRSGWIKQEDLDDLKILCYIEQKKWKDDSTIQEQMQKALERFYHLTENLFFIGGAKLVRSLGNRLTKDLEKNQNPLMAFSLISGFHETFHPNMEEISPYVPIMQRMMYNFVRYYSDKKDANFGSFYGSIPVGGNKILAYVKEYFPLPIFTERTSKDYEVFRLPYPNFCERMQGVCLVNGKGKIMEDSGLVLKHEDVYGISLMKNAFIYCGADSKKPFTMSPFELMSVPDFTKENSSETFLKTFFEEDFPLPGKTAFIPLPQKEQDRNIVELIFLEDLQEEGKRGNPDALRAVAYIEAETNQKLDQLIETLTQDQLKIIEEQEKVSKAVTEDKIEGRSKKKAKDIDKSKRTKEPSNFKKTNQPAAQKVPAKPLGKEKNFQDKLQDIKKKGRVKYRKVIEVINRIMKHPISHALTGETDKGSHKVLHSDKGVVTSVKTHGKKDLTIPIGKLNRFTERLLNIIDLKY